MKVVHLDRIQTFAEYAQQEGISLDAVYKRSNRGDFHTLLIGGRKFVYDQKRETK